MGEFVNDDDESLEEETDELVQTNNLQKLLYEVQNENEELKSLVHAQMLTIQYLKSQIELLNSEELNTINCRSIQKTKFREEALKESDYYETRKKAYSSFLIEEEEESDYSYNYFSEKE